MISSMRISPHIFCFPGFYFFIAAQWKSFAFFFLFTKKEKKTLTMDKHLRRALSLSLSLPVQFMFKSLPVECNDNCDIYKSYFRLLLFHREFVTNRKTMTLTWCSWSQSSEVCMSRDSQTAHCTTVQLTESIVLNSENCVHAPKRRNAQCASGGSDDCECKKGQVPYSIVACEFVQYVYFHTFFCRVKCQWHKMK